MSAAPSQGGLTQALAMPQQRTDLEKAVGKLISAVQKEWVNSLGEPGAPISEEVMSNCHSLLQAAKVGKLTEELRGGPISDFLGPAWVRLHPDVIPAIQTVEELLAAKGHG
jgi:hypothetical protein